MLGLLMPPDVSRYLTMPLLVTAIRADGLRCPLEYRTAAGRIDLRNCRSSRLAPLLPRHETGAACRLSGGKSRGCMVFCNPRGWRDVGPGRGIACRHSPVGGSPSES